MRWCEPLTIGDKAREHVREYRFLLEALQQAEYKELKFYAIAAAANEQNLMELLPASHLKQIGRQTDSLVIVGLAADKAEAMEVCRRLVEDCYTVHGCISRELLFTE